MNRIFNGFYNAESLKSNEIDYIPKIEWLSVKVFNKSNENPSGKAYHDLRVF